MNNSSESLKAKILTQPNFNVSIKEESVHRETFRYWKYSDSLGFSLGDALDAYGKIIDKSLYKIYAECIPLDQGGNEIVANSTIKAIEYDPVRGVYIRDSLEPETTYNVKIFTGAEEEELKTYAYSYAKSMNNCTTASKNKVETGYFCYNSNSFYSEFQLLGEPVGIVTAVNSFSDARFVMGLYDIEAGSLREAVDTAKKLTEGSFIWQLPEADDFEAIFKPGLVEKILSALEKAGGSAFATSSIDENGFYTGKYLTQTAGSTANTVLAFDVSGSECSSAQEVYADGSGGSFRVRPFAVVTTQE